MDKRCTVCNHSQKHDINLALLAGATLDTLKTRFGLSRSALHRHKQHLQKTLDQVEDRMRQNVLLGYLFQLNGYNDAVAGTVAAARAEGNQRLILQAANAGTRIINTMAKFEVDLDHETLYRFMTAPEYVQSGCLLPGDPQILTGPRQSLVASLTAACPEPAPSGLCDPEDGSAYLNLARDPEANTHVPQSRPREFPGFPTPLAGVLPAAAGSPSTAAQQHPDEMRDTSGTEAGQTAPCFKEISKYQSDKQDAGKSGTAPAAPRKTGAGSRPPDTGNHLLETPPETGNQKPETDPAALADISPPNLPPETQNVKLHTPLPDIPPEENGAQSKPMIDYIVIMDDIPVHRWRENYRSQSRWADIEGAY